MKDKELLELIKTKYQEFFYNKITLIELARIFNIPIDEERKEDYILKNIDFNKLYIEILDKKTGTIYKSYYNVFDQNINYDTVLVNDLDSNLKCLYTCPNSSIPMQTKLDFLSDDFKITLTRENNLDSKLKNGTRKFTVNYYQIDESLEKCLLTRTYQEKIENGKPVSTFEEDRNILTPSKDSYSYLNNGYIVYGINELLQPNVCSMFSGLCIENTRYINSKQFPINMPSTSYIRLHDVNLRSAILFKGRTMDQCFHSLDIYKNDDNIYLSYYAKGSTNNNDYQISSVIDKGITMPSLVKGNITTQEIDKIIQALKDILSNNDFIAIIIDELNEFKVKMEDKNSNFIEENMLNPKSLINMNDYETFRHISEYKKDYFEMWKEYLKYSIDPKRTLKRN